MELRLATPEQMKTVYERDLKPSFPPAELKPLRAMEEMYAEGLYRPWCLFDGGRILGEAFLWLDGTPGWALLDYLCVSPQYRNAGTGAVLLEKLQAAESGTVIFGESEIPDFAPDPALAKRRLGFYARNGARTAGYDTAMFGVPYKTLYWAKERVPDAVLMEQHRAVYQKRFSPSLYAAAVRIPFDASRGELPPRMPWRE